MKFVATADLHIIDRTPRFRKDDYYKTILNKFKQICKLAGENGKLLVIAGDIFDTPNVPYEVTRDILEIIQKSKIDVLVVAGQHDLRYHQKGLKNTPLGILQTAGAVKLLSPDKALNSFDNISFLGVGWNQKVNSQADVVVTHTMVINENKLWEGQEEYTTAKEMLNDLYPFARCIISGDNHQPFIVKQKSRLLINCGSMMRKSVDQIDHKPKVYIVNMDKCKISLKESLLSIEPASDVFDFDRLENETRIKGIKSDSEEAIKQKTKDLIDLLPSEEREKPKFKNVLKLVIEKSKPSDSVKEIINDIMEDIDE